MRKVVNVSSLIGLFGNAGQANYAAAKAGVSGLTQSLAKEWGRMNVTVNSVAFGFIKTRLSVRTEGQSTIDINGQQIQVGLDPEVLPKIERSIPLGRGGTPEEAAGAVYLLCIPESDYISGQTLVCSGGLTSV
jgi:3-oxoacyl-[acyl-carrier protein] reductase